MPEIVSGLDSTDVVGVAGTHVDFVSLLAFDLLELELPELSVSIMTAVLLLPRSDLGRPLPLILIRLIKASRSFRPFMNLGWRYPPLLGPVSTRMKPYKLSWR